jgi:hypothetical protein
MVDAHVRLRDEKVPSATSCTTPMMSLCSRGSGCGGDTPARISISVEVVTDCGTCIFISCRRSQRCKEVSP